MLKLTASKACILAYAWLVGGFNISFCYQFVSFFFVMVAQALLACILVYRLINILGFCY